MRLLASPERARPPVVVHTFHGHVLRGYFGAAGRGSFLQIERALARSTDALIAVSPEVRDDLVGLGVAAAGEDSSSSASGSTSRRAPRRRRVRGRGARPGSAIPDERLPRRLARPHDRDQARRRPAARVRARCARAASQARLAARRATGRCAPPSSGSPASSGIAEAAHFAGYPARGRRRCYAAIDTVALTSANEGTPVTLIEALAAGLPGGRTDVGGVRGRRERRPSRLPRARRRHRGARGRARPARTATPSCAGASRTTAAPACSAATRPAARRRRRRALPGGCSSRQGRTPARAGVAPLPPTLSATRVERGRARGGRCSCCRSTSRPRSARPSRGCRRSPSTSPKRGHDVTVIAEFPNHPARRHAAGVPRAPRRGRPFERLPRAARLGEREPRRRRQRTPDALLPLVHGARDGRGAARRSRGRRRRDVAAALHRRSAGLALARLNGAPVRPRRARPVARCRRQPQPDLERLGARVPPRRSSGVLYRAAAAAVAAVTRPFCEHIDAIRDGRTRDRARSRTGRSSCSSTPARGDEPRAVSAPTPDDFVVTFAGTLRDRAGAAVRARGGRSRRRAGDRVLVGDGPMKATLVELAARSSGPTNVHFRPAAAARARSRRCSRRATRSSSRSRAIRPSSTSCPRS